MELRVWVDGTQRVVCGVKLTTTCQEIVFALAHATQQAGRFTMIERWRNNERLLSPNEQPLVTLQRWGDHMNEVEFILRKTSTDIPTINNQQQSHQQQQQQPAPQPIQRPQQNTSRTSQDEPNQHDLYSTINKKRISQPPAVPAKPRVMGPLTSVNSGPLPLPHHQLQPSVNNAQVNNYYHTSQSPLNMYNGNLRLRHPPGYLDYMEAMASRSTMTQPIMANPTYAPQNHQHASNIYRPFDPQQLYNMPRINSSPAEISAVASNRYPYPVNGQMNHIDCDQSQQHDNTKSIQNINPIRPKIMDSGLVINRGSAVNVKLPSSCQNLAALGTTNERLESQPSSLKSVETGNLVSQLGHDMLKVIEEQKKVLLNQKSELDRLDNDQEYWEKKQKSKQAELINRIESEIRQLEGLWKENQTQIQKLENQDFEKELQELKSEQMKMEEEIQKQRGKLSQFEEDIMLCKGKIKQLESELEGLDSSENLTSNGEQHDDVQADNLKINNNSEKLKKPEETVKQTIQLDLHKNGSVNNNNDHLNNKETSKSSDEEEEEDFEEDSGGDASDDLSTDNKTRSAKDVAYVDKRGIISGIRSLKLDKSRAFNNRQMDSLRSTDNSAKTTTNNNNSSLCSKDKSSKPSDTLDKRCPETNGQYSDKTANNNYQFFMTL